MEFSVVGENLFQPHHAEFGGNPGPVSGSSGVSMHKSHGDSPQIDLYEPHSP
jgi:hypothetical protein